MALQMAELGVLLNHSQLLGALAGRYGFEFLPFYSEAAKMEGADVVFFSPQSIIGKEQILFGFKWSPKLQCYQHGVFAIPSVIHNRAFLSESDRIQISTLTASEQTILFNRTLRFDKWNVHQLLMQDAGTAVYLPATAPLTSVQQIKDWLTRHQTVYLKPRNSSLGLGILRVSESGHNLQIARTVKGSSHSFQISKHKLRNLFTKINSRPYLIQEGLPLMKISGKPVDFRVSVQKNSKGKWTVSGIVAKVGKKDSHATNLAVGGVALAARDVLGQVFGRDKALYIYEELGKSALQLAGQLDSLDMWVADLGLDLAVTDEAEIKFIEVNARDLRITFRDANEEKMWRTTFYNPIRYGLHLLANKEEGDGASIIWANTDDKAGNYIDRQGNTPKGTL